MNMKSTRWVLLGFVGAALIACSTTTVKSTEYVQVVQDTAPNEDLLMDIGVTVFDPGIDELDRDEEERVRREYEDAQKESE